MHGLVAEHLIDNVTITTTQTQTQSHQPLLVLVFHNPNHQACSTKCLTVENLMVSQHPCLII